MAKVLSRQLRTQAVRVWRISNAKHFKHQQTVVYFNPGHESEAKAIGEILPVSAKIEPAPSRLKRTGIRIVIGKDIVDHDMAREITPIPARATAA